MPTLSFLKGLPCDGDERVEVAALLIGKLEIGGCKIDYPSQHKNRPFAAERTTLHERPEWAAFCRPGR
jgi:hypothetical protein